MIASLSLSLALCASCIPSPAVAVPATPEISQKQTEMDSALAELERKRADLEVRIEEYNAITEAVEQTEVEIVSTRGELDRATAQLRSAQDVLADRATNIYKHGGMTVMDVFLGVRSFDDLMTRFDLLRRISAADAAIVASVQHAKQRVESAERMLELRHAEQLALQTQARARAAAIEAEVSRQQGYVERLDADVRRLIAEEEERERQLAAERARVAAAAAAAAARRAAEAASGDAGKGETDSRSPVTATAPGGVVSGSIVDVALLYLGVPYVWGGSSPSGFDCSGLVCYVYRQVGVSLPRTSQSQFRVGQHIPADQVDQLQPGDLVFFGTDGDPSRVHHVGIYIGGGDYVHAPHTGAVVRINSLTARIQSSGDYVGGSRI
ncbi:MAG: C40 family peptidase [Coriobacteriia bacterium]|nr:C40 family peptidase [Coriobacteriia bacterium]